MGSLKTADLSLAKSLNLNIKELGVNFVVEPLGVVDTGADVGVGDKVIRRVLGKEQRTVYKDVRVQRKVELKIRSTSSQGISR